jgi:hypothetical protein
VAYCPPRRPLPVRSRGTVLALGDAAVIQAGDERL